MEEKPAELPVSEQEVQIPSPSFLDKLKIHKFKILGGILGILVFVGAVFGAYKLGQKQIQPGPGPIPTPVVVATPTPDLTANWKTYTNTKYGFSFKYPSSLFLRPDSDPEFTGFLETPGENQSQKLVVFVIENPENIDLQELSEKNKPIPDDRTSIAYEKSEINGYETLIIRSERPCIGFTEICEKFNNIDKNYTVIIKGNKFVVSFSVENNNPGGTTRADEEWLNRILSTFRFLE